MDDILRIYIGWDAREDEAYQICKTSIVRRTSRPVHITPLKLSELYALGVYTRAWTKDENGQRFDSRDKKPFSTDFSFSRFLVPHLQNYMGTALFVDCDFLFNADIAELFDLMDPSKAVMCVQHNHVPLETQKMDGQLQTLYRRKNWSSLMLWNCAHPAHRDLTWRVVSEKPGSWLHAFEWLKDEDIGSLPMEWNWLEGWSPTATKPKGVHMTRGGPWMPSWQHVAYADEWRSEKRVAYESRDEIGARIINVK